MLDCRMTSYAVYFGFPCFQDGLKCGAILAEKRIIKNNRGLQLIIADRGIMQWQFSLSNWLVILL